MNVCCFYMEICPGIVLKGCEQLRCDLLQVLLQCWDVTLRSALLMGAGLCWWKGEISKQGFAGGCEEVRVNSTEAGTCVAKGKGS